MKVLGAGSYGVVIMPPLPCANNMEFPSNSVGKIGLYSELKREYDFMVNYANVNKNFINRELIRFCEIDKKDIPDEIAKVLFDDRELSDQVLYQLVMPFLGNTLDKFIQQFKMTCRFDRNALDYYSSNQNDRRVMDVATFQRLMIAVADLFEDIATLNRQHIHHNDIKPNNMIYNEEANQIFLIDYGLSISIKIPEIFVHEIEKKEIEDKKDFGKNVLIHFFRVGMENKNIANKFAPLFKDLVALNYDIQYNRITNPNEIETAFRNIVTDGKNLAMSMNEETDDGVQDDASWACEYEWKFQRKDPPSEIIRRRDEDWKIKQQRKQERETMASFDVRMGGRSRRRRRLRRNARRATQKKRKLGRRR